MKKQLFGLSAILLASSLVGCGDTPTIDHEHKDKNHDCICDICYAEVDTKHVDNNHDGSCDVCKAKVKIVHVDEDRNKECDVCKADLAPDSDYEGLGWDIATARLFKNKLGIVIPYVPNISYSYEYGIDIYGDNYVNAYLEYSSEEKATQALNNYYNICEAAGYEMTLGNLNITQDTYYEGVAFADYIIEGNKAVEITFLVSKKNNKDCLGIFATNYLYIPKTEFPLLAIEKALPYNYNQIPVLDREDATYSFYFNYLLKDGADELNVTADDISAKYLEIHVNTDDYSVVEEFFNGLVNQRYNTIYHKDPEDYEKDVIATSWPDFIPGDEFWCYHDDPRGLAVPYTIQFGFEFGYTWQGIIQEPYFYCVIYYDIAE